MPLTRGRYAWACQRTYWPAARYAFGLRQRSSHAGHPDDLHLRTVAMPEVSETDFAIVVFREDDG